MRDTTGDLFSSFDSNITLTNADIVNVTPSQMLIYLSHSVVDITSVRIFNISLNDVGSLATVFDQSVLRLSNVTVGNISSSEHGIISLQESKMGIFSSSFAGFNASLIVAEQSSVGIVDSQVSDVFISFEGKTLSMLPSGGLLSCSDCPIIHIANTHCRNISANEGGVIHAEVFDRKLLGEIILEHSSFEYCAAKTAGGVVKSHFAYVSLRNCTFKANQANLGAVIDFEGSPQLLHISGNRFLQNQAFLDGSCLHWLGTAPEQSDNIYEGNKALYGNPEASAPHHFALLSADSLQPVMDVQIQGVTGQQMVQPLLIGVFDSINQLIVTNNSTLITLQFPSNFTASGNTDAISEQGIASFTLLFTPFSTATVTLTFSSPKDNIQSLTITYRFRDCVPGEIRTSNGCFPCQKNSYSFQPSDPACLLCPAHAVCYGRADLSVNPDYWRANNLTDDIYPCLVAGACIGGVQQTCAAGYTGTLCGACEEGFYQYGMWKCRECENEISPEARGVIVAALVLSAVVLPHQLFQANDGHMYRFAIVFRVFMNYAHTMLFVVLLHVQWPFTTLVHHEVLRTIGSLGSILIYSGCQYRYLTAGAYYFQVIATTFYPLLLVLTACFFWSIAELKLRYGFKKMFRVILSTSLVTVYTFLPALSLMIISMYQCQEVAGDTWLVADLSQRCWTGRHLYYVEGVTVPLVVAIMAYHFMVNLVLKRKWQLEVLVNFQVYLKSGFKMRRENWELRVMLRKILLLYLSLAYSKLDRFSHIVLFSCIIGSSIHTELKSMPYVSYWLNVMNLSSHVSVFAIVLLSESGSEAELTAVSCIGTFLVMGLGCRALWDKMVEPKKRYVVEEGNSVGQHSRFLRRTNHSNVLQRVSGESSENLGLNVPPSTPQSAEKTQKTVELRDISIAEID